jgi:hypothetical protein
MVSVAVVIVLLSPFSSSKITNNKKHQ